MPTPLPAGKLVKARRLWRAIEAYEIAFALMAAAAIGLASFVYCGVRDQAGASLILIGVAGLLAVFTTGSRKSRPD